MTLLELWRHCRGIAPEMLLSATICLILILDMFLPLRRSHPVVGLTALAGTLLALVAQVLVTSAGAAALTASNFRGMLAYDQLSAFFKILFLTGLAATFLFSLRSLEIRKYRQGEYYSLLLGAVLGACFLAGSDHFVMFILGLETLSICSYVLAAFLKHDRFSSEAGLKYLLFGAVASGIMLFGISYLYGMTGTLQITGGITELMSRPNPAAAVRLSILLVLTLILAGLGYKMAMVPFHFWCPDVYQGSPTPVTAFLSVVSKAAGFAALLRVFAPFFRGAAVPATLGHAFGNVELPLLFGVLSMVTMTFGNLVAMRQNNVKRLLAYSSIAHAGYLLMGMTVFAAGSLEAILFYFAIYLLMNLGAFWVVIALENRTGGVEIERFRGAAYKAPFLFAAMFVFLISLTGLPPTAGFVAKFMLFKVVVAAGLTAMGTSGGPPMAVFYLILALVGVLNSAVALYYYMRIVRSMAFEEPAEDSPLGESLADKIYGAAFALPVLALLYFVPILRLIEWAGR